MAAGDTKTVTRLAQHDVALSSLLVTLLAETEDCASGQPVEPAPSDINLADELKSTPSPPIHEREETRKPLPAWAAADFKVLLFWVGDYRFAVPMVLMDSVAAMPEQLTRLPGQPAWHLGMVCYRGRTLIVAELGGLIDVAATCASPRYLLVLGDGRHALACDRVEDTAVINPDAVRWRVATESKPWWAGLLVKQMCVLLDTDALSRAMRHE